MKKIKSRKKRENTKKVFKWGLFLFLMLVGLSTIGKVDAGMNDSVIEKNRVEGVYAVSTSNGANRLFYLNMYRINGRISYCIQLGVDIITDIYHSTNDFSVSYLTEEQIEYIRSISYFGYGYDGHNDNRYYMAAQEIIWEYLGNGKVGIEWTSQQKVNGLRIDLQSYKDEILKSREKYYNEATFDWTNGQSYFGGSIITLEDKSKILSDYEVIYDGYSMSSIKDNTLEIAVSKEYLGMDTVRLQKRQYYDYDSLLYYYDNSQMLISNGNFKKITSDLNFKIVGKNIEIQVVDNKTKESIPLGQASLDGAKYMLYNAKGELIGEYVTNESGRFVINNLGCGEYYFKQIEASKGYLVNQEKIKVEIVPGIDTYILEQEVISNVIEIQKMYGTVGEYVPEESILFEIYNNNGELYDEIITDKEGMASIWLPYGEYKIKQSNTTLGYSKVDDFNVNIYEQKEETIYFHLINELIKCKIRIHIYDKESGMVIKQKDFGYKIRKKDRNDYLMFEGQEVFYTDENGEVILPIFLPYGEYIIEQVDVPNEFLFKENIISLTIDEKVEFIILNGELFIDINVYNNFIKGDVNVFLGQETFYSDINQYGYKNLPIKKEKLTLVANEDIVVNGEVLYKQNDYVMSELTNEDGKVSFINLNLGNYCLVGQNILVKECFTLTSLSDKKQKIEKNIELINKLDKSNILIKNKDDYGEIIEGVVIEIYNREGLLLYTGITNEDGNVIVNNLLNDSYCIKQKKVPDSYLISNNEQCFSLNGNKNIEIINKKERKDLVMVPDTLSEDIGLFEIINICLLLGMILIVYKKIFCSS